MIIGIVGLIGSGKGTVGDLLVNEFNYHNDSFAKPLKDAISIMFNWPRNLLEGDTEESRKFRETVDSYWTKELGWEVTPRKALQLMGTEAGRDIFGENLWTSALFDRWWKLSTSKCGLVITDVRFQNEINAIRRNHGYVVRVKRGPEPDWMELALKQNYWGETLTDSEKSQLPHISEWDWVGTPFNYIIDNNGTLADLKNNVSDMLNYLEFRD